MLLNVKLHCVFELPTLVFNVTKDIIDRLLDVT